MEGGIISTRSKRYLSEVRRTLTQVLSDDELPDLIAAESNVTVEGLAKRVVLLNAEKNHLKEEIVSLKGKAEKAQEISGLKLQIAELHSENETFKREVEICKHEREIKLAAEANRVDSLQREIGCLNEALHGKKLLIEKYKRGFEDKESELKCLRTEGIRLQNDVQRLELLAEKTSVMNESELEDLRSEVKSHQSFKDTLEGQMKQQILDLERRHAMELRERELTVESFQSEVKNLQQRLKNLDDSHYSMKQLRDVARESQSAVKQLQEAEVEIQKLKCQLEEYQTRDEAGRLARRRAEQLMQTSAMQDAEMASLKSQLSVWQRLAAGLMDKALDTEDSQAPYQFSDFVIDAVKRRDEALKQAASDHLRCSKLENEVQSVSEKLRSSERGLREMELQRAEVDLRADSLLKANYKLQADMKVSMPSQSTATMSTDGSSGQTSSNFSVDSARCSLIDELKDEVRRLSGQCEESRHFMATNSELNAQLHVALQGRDSAAEKCTRLAERVDQLKSRNDELLKQKKLLMLPPPDRQEIEAEKARLESERDEVVKKNRVLREYYKFESQSTKKALGQIFGWDIKIDCSPPTLNVVIRSQFCPRDDDAEFVFVVPVSPPQQASLATPLTPQPSKDEEPKLELQLQGRYASKWETDERWQNQLIGSNSYAYFLALTNLEEFEASMSRRRKVTAGRGRAMLPQKPNPAVASTPLNSGKFEPSRPISEGTASDALSLAGTPSGRFASTDTPRPVAKLGE